MEDFKKENTIENKEHIPSKEEVLSVISKFAENSEVVEENSNEEGLFMLNTKGIPDSKGKYQQYEYMKKGVYPGFSGVTETLIYISEYDEDGIPYYGFNAAVYDEELKSWFKINPENNTKGERIEVSIENNESKKNVDEQKNIENTDKKDELLEQYKEDQDQRNNLQNELTGENFNQVKPAILAEEEMMRGLQKNIENTENLRESGIEVAELESIMDSFEQNYSLDVLNSIIETTLEDAMNHPVRKPAKAALGDIFKKLEVLNRETNISNEKQIVLEEKYKQLSKAIGFFSNNRIIHEDRSIEKVKYYN